MIPKKKTFPKLQKKLRGFLTDESGKISKKDALGLSAGAILLMGTEEAMAAVTAGHGQACAAWVNVTATGPDVVDTNNAALWPTSKTETYYNSSLISAGHGSGIVNGHFSQAVNSNLGAPYTATANGVGHGSHASHGSHCSCTRWG